MLTLEKQMISISVSQSNQVHRSRFDLGHYSNQTHLMYFNHFMTIKEKGNNNLSQVHVQFVLNNVDQKFTVCNMHEYRKESIITRPTHSLDTNFEWQSFNKITDSNISCLFCINVERFKNIHIPCT